MRRWAWPVTILACVAGCGGSGGDALPEDALPAPDSGAPEDAFVVQDTLIEPGFPRAERGRLVTVSAGRDTLAGSWRVRGGRCAEPPSLQLLSETGDVGTMLLVILPDSGPVAVEYSIHPADTALVPGAARLAVYLFTARRPAAYEVRSGALTLERFDERVSGRFMATLRNITTRDSLYYGGVFHEVPVDTLPAGLCLPAADASGAD